MLTRTLHKMMRPINCVEEMLEDKNCPQNYKTLEIPLGSSAVIFFNGSQQREYMKRSIKQKYGECLYSTSNTNCETLSANIKEIIDKFEKKALENGYVPAREENQLTFCYEATDYNQADKYMELANSVGNSLAPSRHFILVDISNCTAPSMWLWTSFSTSCDYHIRIYETDGNYWCRVFYQRVHNVMHTDDKKQVRMEEYFSHRVLPSDKTSFVLPKGTSGIFLYTKEEQRQRIISDLQERYDNHFHKFNSDAFEIQKDILKLLSKETGQQQFAVSYNIDRYCRCRTCSNYIAATELGRQCVLSQYALLDLTQYHAEPFSNVWTTLVTSYDYLVFVTTHHMQNVYRII